jgi:hypothetical protein
MQIVERAPARSLLARVFGGTCPDCCGDLAVALVEGGWVLACIHCGATIRSSSGYPLAEGPSTRSYRHM